MTLAWQLAALVACGALVLLWSGGPAALPWRIDQACPVMGTDFVRHFYPSIATGTVSPGWYYPPTLAVLLAPLGALPAGTAATVWLWFQVGLLVVWAVAPPHATADTPRWMAVAYTALAALSMPVLQCLVWGQVSTLLVLVGFVSFLALARAPVWAGAGLGVAAAVKLYPVLWWAWPAAKRRWKALATAGVTTLLGLFVLPWLLWGAAHTATFYTDLARALERDVPQMASLGTSQYLPDVGTRLLGAGVRTPLTLVAWAVAAALLLLLFRMRRDAGPDRTLRAFVVASGMFAFLVPSSWMHYFVHLPVAWLVLGRALWRTRGGATVGSLLAVSVLFGTLPWYAVANGANIQEYAGYGWLAWSNVAALAAVAVLGLRGAGPAATLPPR